MSVSNSKRNFALLGALLALALHAAPARAALEIRNAPIKNVSCSAGVCTATHHYAVMNAGDLTSMLANSDVTLRSGSRASDIEVKASLSWASASRLTLDSYHSILFYKPLTVAGTGALTMTTDDGGQYGSLLFFGPGSVKFWDTSSNLIIDGQPYTLASSISQLAQEIAANPNGNYALANNYNAKPDGVYAQAPIPTVFNGTFQGLGHTISNLTINDLAATDGTGVGLFAGGGSAKYANLHLPNVHVTAAGVSSGKIMVGGLVGNGGYEFRITVSGSIAASVTDSNMTYYVGGISGSQTVGPVITNSFSSATVSGSGAGYIGGLTGYAYGAIAHDTASGSISGDANHASDVGGLVGRLLGGGTIKFSSATGQVSGAGGIGGLIGAIESTRTDADVSNSHATGNVLGDSGSTIGGLIGIATDAIVVNSYATGSAVTGYYQGGLIGFLDGGKIDQSFATGSVTGECGTAGGLVGTIYFFNDSTISNSFATGQVGIGKSCGFAGGLVGYRHSGTYTATITASYSAGPVSANTAGGSIGYDQNPPGTISFDFWDLDTSGISDPSRGAGNIANDPGITGLTDAQLKSGLPSGFDPAIWAENPSINGGLPYLLANPPP